MAAALGYFATPGPISAPGPHARLFDALPADPASLARLVQGLTMHIFWAEQYGLQLTEERRAEVQLRWLDRRLDRLLELDPAPLTQARPADKRLVGNCRDFSLLLTAMLRHHRVPARARCGFARYFMPDHYEDHWVCEYWHAAQQRWVLVDAQMDELQSRKLVLSFDPLDVPRDQFIVGGKAWQLCRSGQADPDNFGIFELKGLWFVRGNLVRDVAALNKVELLPWDGWGIITTQDTELETESLALLDQVADLTSGEAPPFDQVRQLYEQDERLRVPAKIQSYTQQGVKTVDLARH